MDEPAASPPPWQFSIRQILVVTAALAVLLGLWREDPDLGQVYMMYSAVFFFCALWAGLLATLAGAKCRWRLGVATGAIGMVLVHLTLWLMFNGKYVLDDELSFVGILPVAMVASLNLCALGWSWSRETTSSDPEASMQPADAQRCRAAWQSLAAVGGMVLVSILAGRPYHGSRHAQEAIYAAVALLILSVAPWFVVWRRRQLAGYVYPFARPDRVARFLSWSAVPIAIGSSLPLVLFLVVPHGLRGWDAVNGYVLCLFALSGAHALGLLMVAISVVIQWYRDRWFVVGNRLTLGYIGLLIAAQLAFG